MFSIGTEWTLDASSELRLETSVRIWMKCRCRRMNSRAHITFRWGHVCGNVVFQMFKLSAHVLSCVILTSQLENSLTHSQSTDRRQKNWPCAKRICRSEREEEEPEKMVYGEYYTQLGVRCALYALDENRTLGCKYKHMERAMQSNRLPYLASEMFFAWTFTSCSLPILSGTLCKHSHRDNHHVDDGSRQQPHGIRSASRYF